MKIIAVDIGGTATKIACFEDGICTEKMEFPINGRLGAKFLLEAVFSHIADFSSFDRIGISTAGQVDFSSGSILYANDNIPGYTGTPLRQLVEEWFAVPAVVENDVYCAAIGEAFHGAGQGAQNFLCLTIGTGIGGAIFADGKLFTGTGYRAGEFGHLITHPGGAPCNCGRKGCYEQYASTTALVKSAVQIDPDLTDGRKVFHAYDAGSPAVQALIAGWLDEIFLGLVSLNHLFDPEKIILGGGIMNEPWLAGEIEKQLRAAVIPSYRGVQVTRASLGNMAGLFGAAELARKIKN